MVSMRYFQNANMPSNRFSTRFQLLYLAPMKQYKNWAIRFWYEYGLVGWLVTAVSWLTGCLFHWLFARFATLRWQLLCEHEHRQTTNYMQTCILYMDVCVYRYTICDCEIRAYTCTCTPHTRTPAQSLLLLPRIRRSTRFVNEFCEYSNIRWRCRAFDRK